MLADIGQATQPNGKAFWESYITQISFIILLSCHIPFIFFAGKEGLLITLDELDRKSISNALFHKLYATNTAFAAENEDTMPPNPNLPMPGSDFLNEEVRVSQPGNRSQTAVLFENVDRIDTEPDKT